MEYDKGTYVDLPSGAAEAVPPTESTSSDREAFDYSKGTHVELPPSAVRAIPASTEQTIIEPPSTASLLGATGARRDAHESSTIIHSNPGAGEGQGSTTVAHSHTGRPGRAHLAANDTAELRQMAVETDEEMARRIHGEDLTLMKVDKLAQTAQVQMMSVGDDLDVATPISGVEKTEQAQEKRKSEEARDRTTQDLKKIIAGMVCLVAVAVVAAVVVVLLLLLKASDRSDNNTAPSSPVDLSTSNATDTSTRVPSVIGTTQSPTSLLDENDQGTRPVGISDNEGSNTVISKPTVTPTKLSTTKPTTHPTGPPSMTPTFRPTEPPTQKPTDVTPTSLRDILNSVDADFSLEALDDIDSPQHIARRWVEEHRMFSSMEPWRKLQLYALATFYYAANGPGSAGLQGWLNPDTDECTWSREDVNGPICIQGRYVQLDLAYFSLPRGTIPPEISFLSSLSRISFAASNLQGVPLESVLPTQLALLESLESIRFVGSYIGGTIPPYISDFSSLRFLYISSNRMGGSIPEELWDLQNLREVDLGNNYLGGTISSKLGNLGFLRRLELQGNLLSSTIPTQIGGLASVEYINFSENYGISGTVPTEIGLLTSLSSLDIGFTTAAGKLPDEVCMLETAHRLRRIIVEIYAECPDDCIGLCEYSV